MFTLRSAFPSCRRERFIPQPAFSVISVCLLLLLALTNALAQSRAAQLQQRESEQVQLRQLRADNPNLPFVLAQGENQDATKDAFGVAAYTHAAAASAAAGMPPRWNQLAGPEAGQINALYEKNGRVFAATLGGIYYSDDQGVTWQRAYGSPAKYATYGIVSVGDALFYGTDAYGITEANPGGVFRSLDNGLTWEHISNGLPETVGVFHVAALPNGTLLASTQSGMVFRSTDSGTTWVQVKNGLPDQLGFFLIAGSTRAALGVSGKGLFRSTDGGASWESIQANLPPGPRLRGQVAVVLGNRFIVSSNTDGVLISDDDGATWRAANQGLPAGAAVSNLVLLGSDVYVPVANGALYRSTDQGESWVKQNDDFAFGKTVYASLKVGDTLLVGTGDGVYRSEDQGQTWLRSNDGLRNASLDGGILAVNNRLYVAAASGIWATDTKGASWYLLNKGFRQYPFTTVYGSGLGIKDGVLFAGAFGDGLYRSFDGGGSWERLSNGLPESWGPSAIKVSNGKIYATNWFGGAFVSADDGATWQAIQDLPADMTFLCFAEMSPGHLLAGAYPGGVFRSDDDGQTWRAFQTGVRDEFIDDFLVDNTNILVGTDDGVYRMNEDESGWSEIPYYKENVKGGVNSFIKQGKAIYASTFGRGIQVSYNNGETWGSFNQGMDTLRGFYFAVIKGDLYFGSAGAGVWIMRTAVKTPPIILPPDEPIDNSSGNSSGNQ